MDLALMLKSCRARKPDTEGPGQLKSWLEGFSRSPELEVTWCPGKLTWAQGEHLPVVLLCSFRSCWVPETR